MSKVDHVELTVLGPERALGTPFHWQTESSIARSPIPVRFGFRQGTFMYDSRALSRILDQIRPDVILHEQEVYALSAGQIAAVASKRRIPVVMFVWENTFRRLSFPRKIHRSFVLSKTAGLIAGSQQALKVHESWGFKGPRTVIPQMGVVLNTHPNFGRRRPGVLSVCFAGRLEALKGVDCLIHAIASMQKNGSRVLCKIAGSGPEQAALQNLAHQCNLADTISFPGFLGREALQQLFQESDVLVLPSRRTRDWNEQFGRVLPEAMANGCVAIGSRTGAIPEVIGSDELTFEENDDHGLALILKRFAGDDIFLERAQRQSWCRAKELYTNEFLAKSRVDFVQSVLR